MGCLCLTALLFASHSCMCSFSYLQFSCFSFSDPCVCGGRHCEHFAPLRRSDCAVALHLLCVRSHLDLLLQRSGKRLPHCAHAQGSGKSVSEVRTCVTQRRDAPDRSTHLTAQRAHLLSQPHYDTVLHPRCLRAGVRAAARRPDQRTDLRLRGLHLNDLHLNQSARSKHLYNIRAAPILLHTD